MAYSFENSKGKTYYLHTKDVTLKGGRNQTIYYLAKTSVLMHVIFLRVRK